MVLFVGLSHIVLELFGRGRLDGRVEDRLFDVHVDQELALDGLEERLLGAESVVAGRIVLLDQILNDLMVGLEEAGGSIGRVLSNEEKKGRAR